MNREEFIGRVNSWDGKPASFDDDYKTFLEYQKLAYSTLMAFHNVCESNSIKYVLAYGSLLGAIRDGGQIPWDYDCDVFVPYSEKDKLVEALKKNLPDDFYFYSPEVDKRCRHIFLRVAPKGYRSEELHVDVFYYIGAPDGEKERKDLTKQIKKIISHRFYKFVDARYDSYGRKKRYIKLISYKSCCLLCRTEREYSKLYDFSRKYPVENSKYITRYDRTTPRHRKLELLNYYAEDFLNTKLTQVEGGYLRVPVNYDRVLKMTYGDYMTEPSVGGCVMEMISFSRRLKAYAKIGESN